MAQDDHVAVAAAWPGVLDDRIAHGAHPRSGRRRVIDAVVGAPSPGNGVYPQSEARAHAGEFERRAQEGLAQAVAVWRVVAVAVMHRAIRLAAARELGREHAPRAHRPTGKVMELIHHGELVAFAQVAVEVDVAGENI